MRKSWNGLSRRDKYLGLLGLVLVSCGLLYKALAFMSLPGAIGMLILVNVFLIGAVRLSAYLSGDDPKRR
jgi:cobalamin synthase